MSIVEKIEQEQLKKDIPHFHAGDTVRVHVKIKEGDKERIQVFEGIVMGRRRAQNHSTFTVRKMSFGVGVERTYPVNSPALDGIEVGQEISPEIFAAGDVVDVTGTSKGKGYAGVMKRHGFHGVGASHSAHRNHRKPGSIGPGTTPGRVYKGLRMGGHMGSERVTIKKLRVVRVDAERNLILVRGSVPGAPGALTFVRKA